MEFKKYYITLILSFLGVSTAFSQTRGGNAYATSLENKTTSESIVNAQYFPSNSDSEAAYSNADDGEFMPKLRFKTNAIAWAAAISNVALEVDIIEHLSFNLPIYYSAWDYFKTTIKFRTLAIQPEVRFWQTPNNDGFFGGAHFGMAYYNLAVDGDYRFQDHNRNTPALGGGLSAGYRWQLGSNEHWQMEFSIGAGVYSIHYDKFHNTKPTDNGYLVKDVKKTYWGLDQLSLSVSYSIDLKKKGGRK